MKPLARQVLTLDRNLTSIIGLTAVLLIGLSGCATAEPTAINPKAPLVLGSVDQYLDAEAKAECDLADRVCALGRAAMIQSAMASLLAQPECANAQDDPSRCAPAAQPSLMKIGARLADLRQRMSAVRGPATRSQTFPGDGGASVEIDAARAYVDQAIADLRSTTCRDDSMICIAGRFALVADADGLARSAGRCGTRTGAERKACETGMFSVMDTIDAESSQLLNLTLDRVGWPDSVRWSPETENNAWLAAQHADKNPELQKRALKLLVQATNDGRSPPRFAAYLIDRRAIHEGRSQTYGTQGSCVSEGDARIWRADPIEDEANVNTRRERAGLPAMPVYTSQMARICHG